MKLQPMFDRVLIKVNPVSQSKVGNLLIPEDDTKQVIEGTVVSVGEGLPEEPMIIQTGYLVMIQKFSGIKIVEDGEDYVICKQKDIIARKLID